MKKWRKIILVQKGIGIIIKKGEANKYILNKNMLYGSTKSLEYMAMWSVQKDKPENYFGKEIYVYRFIVNNHPLEKIYNVDTNIDIMICEGKVIGGTSYPNADIVGSVYSIDGKTLEEVTGLSYIQWCDEWEKKYAN